MFLQLLNERIIEMFPDNPSIKPIGFTEEIITDNGIDYRIRLLKLLLDKPIAKEVEFSPLITKNNKPTNDPFVEPFTPGAYIDEVTESHFVMFNKYSVCSRHVILATKEFER
jgi:ATP adenylyltransferase/5',5'''-P-1,P-4-tetraphosphate phosphorylase II